MNMEAPCLILSNQWIVGENEIPYNLQQAYFDNCIIDGGYSADSTHLYSGEIRFDVMNEDDRNGNDKTFNYCFNACFIKTARQNNERFINNLFIKSPTYLKMGTEEDKYMFDFRLANNSIGIGKADRSIAELYPVDRYGVNRISAFNGPSIGAYEYVYQEEKK